MAIKIEIVRVSEESEKDPNYQACVAMLKHCMLPVEIISDRPRVMKETKGRVNPMNGFMIIASTSKRSQRYIHPSQSSWEADKVLAKAQRGIEPDIDGDFVVEDRSTHEFFNNFLQVADWINRHGLMPA